MKLYHLKKDDKYMKPLLLIKKEKTELLTNSSLMLIKGEVGSGKSRLAMNIMVGFSGVNEELNFEYMPCPDGKHVIYISTEMSRYHLQKRLLQILKITGDEYEKKLIFIDALTSENIIDQLSEVANKFNPHVIIIDQLGDLINDINNLQESVVGLKKITNGLEKYDCGIIGIIHQNEDSGINAKARGHLGSLFEQKVVSSLAIADNSKGFKIKTTKVREGKFIAIDAEFNEATGMLKAVTLLTHEQIVASLSLPCKRNELYDQLKIITKKSSPTTLKIIVDDLIKNEFISEEIKGKSSIINKK